MTSGWTQPVFTQSLGEFLVTSLKTVFPSVTLPFILLQYLFSISLHFCISVYPVTISSDSIISSWQKCCLKHPALCSRSSEWKNIWIWILKKTAHFQYLSKYFKRVFNCTWKFYHISQQICSQDYSFFLYSNFIHCLFTHLIPSSSLSLKLLLFFLTKSPSTCTCTNVLLFPFCSSLKPKSLLLLSI